MAGNLEAIETWNTLLYEKFCRFRYPLTTGLGAHGDAALRLHPPAPGARVLDIGCGFGDTTCELARAVGPAGEAVGVDAASRFVEAARIGAAADCVGNARFEVADVQDAPLGGPYAYAFARFGTMFFDSPGAAMKNVRRAMLPGAGLVLVAWRRREDNEFFHRAELCVRELLGQPPKDDAITCGPGPFSMAGADVVTDILAFAGFTRIGLERNDHPVCIGRDLEEAVQFSLELGPAGEIVRLAGEEGKRRRSEVEAALREVYRPCVNAAGSVLAGGSSWIVTATAA